MADIEAFMTLGKRITRARENANLSVKRLADVTGVPETTIHRIQKGEVTNPRVETIKKLVMALGVSIDQMIFGDDELIGEESLKRAFIQSSSLDKRDIDIITRISAALATIETMEGHIKNQKD